MYGPVVAVSFFLLKCQHKHNTNDRQITFSNWQQTTRKTTTQKEHAESHIENLFVRTSVPSQQRSLSFSATTTKPKLEKYLMLLVSLQMHFSSYYVHARIIKAKPRKTRIITIIPYKA